VRGRVSSEYFTTKLFEELLWFCSQCNKKVHVDVQTAKSMSGSFELEYKCPECGQVFTVRYNAE
jgi:DNA-directed RNA polymerase subunit RPC12/RpoP